MMKLKNTISVILIAAFVITASSGCGASGASIFMKDGSIVNIGDTNPQVQQDNANNPGGNGAGIGTGTGADAGTGTDSGAADAANGGSSGPRYTYEGEYDPSADPFITGGGISPFYNIGNTTATDTSGTPATSSPDQSGTTGAGTTGTGTTGAGATETGATGTTDGSGGTGAPRENAALGGTAAEIISNVSSAVIDEASRQNRDLYVATTGNDDVNDGSYDRPFFSVQKAINTITPGHTIYLLSGIYNGANVMTISGTEKEPINITAYPGASATVSLGVGERGAVFDMNGHSNINISKIRIGYSYATWVYGVFMTEGVHDIKITECEFCNMSCTAAPGYGGAYAVLIYGTGDTEDKAIKNITVYNNDVHDLNTGYSEALAASGNVTDIKFTGNTVYGVSNIGIDLYGGGGYCSSQEFDQPRNCEISGNTVYQCQCPFWSCAGIYVTNSRDCVIKENFAYENAYGIEVAAENNHYQYPTTKIAVTGNTVHDNHDGGITIGGVDAVTSGFVTQSEVTGNILYNNGALVNDGVNGEIHFEKVDGINVTDNIVRNHDYANAVIGCGKTSEYVKNVKFNNNLYAYDKPDKIYFKFQGNDYVGLDAWNKFTGGKDINTVASSNQTK
ncbi:MAG: right-handed parallel beta-helix repeat-containing protein [Lachnospiraceae bacterium]|nr:right-handed parallel beta-helix repeat-containing protein [Lachnospiraceae bacterium]